MSRSLESPNLQILEKMTQGTFQYMVKCRKMWYRCNFCYISGTNDFWNLYTLSNNIRVGSIFFKAIFGCHFEFKMASIFLSFSSSIALLKCFDIIFQCKSFLYAHKTMWAYIVVTPAQVRWFLGPLVHWSVHNCLYWLHFLMDFFHFWSVGQYPQQDIPHQIW